MVAIIAWVDQMMQSAIQSAVVLLYSSTGFIPRIELGGVRVRYRIIMYSVVQYLYVKYSIICTVVLDQ